ncbi:MAG: hypothetical protein TE42_05040 [Candidatus Synechococcus spongiarum SP3]|uniref:Uncharacterized protein n=1 Tax=Candidatus Synechococcus spongiarum SP3 TaxID=1604020 RepID=A0A0G2IWC3_9SYNE|nr:MAG: hypothetical protein TE42_05040 [Candidatus Synechococcus spongiarum SP3]
MELVGGPSLLMSAFRLGITCVNALATLDDGFLTIIWQKISSNGWRYECHMDELKRLKKTELVVKGLTS